MIQRSVQKIMKPGIRQAVRNVLHRNSHPLRQPLIGGWLSRYLPIQWKYCYALFTGPIRQKLRLSLFIPQMFWNFACVKSYRWGETRTKSDSMFKLKSTRPLTLSGTHLRWPRRQKTAFSWFICVRPVIGPLKFNRYFTIVTQGTVNLGFGVLTLRF